MNALSEACSTGSRLETETVFDNPAIPWTPTAKQSVWLRWLGKELLAGGAAGSGKTGYMLMAGLQFIRVKRYSGIIFRRTYPELRMEGSFIPLSKEWLSETPAVWNGTEKTWKWPGGGTLAFGHLQYDDSVYKHQSAEYQFIGVDEAGNFTPFQLRYMRSRLRKTKDFWVPLRYRLTANPGGESHKYLKKEYIIPENDEQKAFIPGTIEDNPHLDSEEYKKTLSDLPPVERQRLLKGDWDVVKTGELFKRQWFQFAPGPPNKNDIDISVRYWDFAATQGSGSYTCGTKMQFTDDGDIYIDEVKRGQWSPGARDKIIKSVVENDGSNVVQVMEQEGGSGGKSQIHNLQQDLPGYAIKSHNPTGKKNVRAAPLASQCEMGNVYLVRSKWNQDFVDEFVMFPDGPTDDQVDSASGAFNWYHNESGKEKTKKAGVWGSQNSESHRLK